VSTVDIGASEQTMRIQLPPPLPTTAAERPVKRRAQVDAVRVLSVYVVLLLLVPSTIVVPGVGAAGTAANMWALVALLWYIATWLSGRITSAPGTRAPRLAFLLFAVCALLSYVALAQRGASGLELKAGDRSLIQLVVWAAIVVIASAGIRNYGRLDQLMRLLVACGSIVAAIGIFEFITGIDLVAYIQIPGMTTSGGGGLMQRGDFVRPTSTTVQPLEFGAVMTLLLPFAIQQAFDVGRRGRIRRWIHVALIASALPMTVSRTSVIGAVVVLATLLPTWRGQRRVRALFVIGFGLVAMKVAVPGLIGTITNLFSSWFAGTDTSTNARTMDYAAVADYIFARPLTGMGFQTFLPMLYQFTDNMYLLALLEIGILGTAAMVGLFLTCMHCGGAGRRRFSEDYQKELGQGFVAGSLVTIVASGTFDTLSFPMFSGVFFLLLGCSGAYYGIARQVARANGRPHHAG
jgi:O-antigen ligase